jgi:hypothetical protein
MVAPLPLMMGEFGSFSLTEPDQAWFYRAMYEQLKADDIGSFFWDLSVSDHKFGVLYSNGTAVAITTALTGPETFTAGRRHRRAKIYYIKPPRFPP